jgi:hypothetical protein
MWARIENNKIVEYYNQKQSIVLNNVRYSSQIFTIWTDAQRKDLGIVPVVISGSHLDTNYYIEKNHSDAIAGDGNSVIRTIGEKVADRKLEDEDAKDDKGNQLLNDDGSKIINYGLKTKAKEKATKQADGLLKSFGWLIQRKVTADTAIPSDVITYMANIRTDHKNICDAIDGASDMDAFIALHTNTYKEVDGEQVLDVVARVNRWTDDKDVKNYRR